MLDFGEIIMTSPMDARNFSPTNFNRHETPDTLTALGTDMNDI